MNLIELRAVNSFPPLPRRHHHVRDEPRHQAPWGAKARGRRSPHRGDGHAFIASNFLFRDLAEQYGLEALAPKARRAPQLPNATPTHIVNEPLALAVTEPTIGCRQYADRGWSIGKTTVQKLLTYHGLGRRAQRMARAAAIAAATTGLVTEAADEVYRYGQCRFTREHDAQAQGLPSVQAATRGRRRPCWSSVAPGT